VGTDEEKTFAKNPSCKKNIGQPGKIEESMPVIKGQEPKKKETAGKNA